jgi:hypothetical protein
MAAIRDLLHDTERWFASLPPDFAFLLALPFLVGLAGLIREAIRHRRDQSA